MPRDQRLNQPALDPIWNDCDDFEETLRPRWAASDPRQDGVGDARRRPRRVVGKRLDEEERIAARDGVQAPGWTMGLLGQRLHRSFREREQTQPRDVTSGQVTQD